MGRRYKNPDRTMHIALAGETPSKYVQRMARTICGKLATGQPLRYKQPRRGVQVDCETCMDAWVTWLLEHPKKPPTVRRFRAWRDKVQTQARTNVLAYAIGAWGAALSTIGMEKSTCSLVS